VKATPKAELPAANQPATFRLIRFFSIASLIGIVIVTASLIWAYRDLTVHNLIEHEGRANADLTRAFSNSVWRKYRSFVTDSSARTREQMLADPIVLALRADVLEKMNGLQIVKVKIYNLDGVTIFSTDESQIGENKESNKGFRNGRDGLVTSQIIFREKFDAFEGTLNERSLISSYVPIRATAGAPAEGVFEVYSDVTEMLNQQNRAQWQVAGLVLFLLGGLYLFLFSIVRKADRIIARQESERAAKEDEIRHRVYHDALTGLPNRSFFSKQLDSSIAQGSRLGHSSALMFIDLDRFKLVNDSLGHLAGDFLLQQVAVRIQSSLRTGEQLFRIGGDEFTVILPHIDGPDDAATLAERILEIVAEPLLVQGHNLVPSATIGIAMHPADGEQAELILKNADAAMYKAKQSGRGSYEFYKADQLPQVQARSLSSRHFAS